VSTTVAVALITALSTLTGAAVSGGVALLVNRGQNRMQHEIAVFNREEQLVKERRRIRRDAYVQFLNQVSKVEYMLDQCWTSVPPVSSNVTGDFSPVDSEVVALNSLINVIAFEGSDDVIFACYAIRLLLANELVCISLLTGRAGPECRKIIARIDPDSYEQIMEHRTDARHRFISVAQKSLSRSQETLNMNDPIVRKSAAGSLECMEQVIGNLDQAIKVSVSN